MTTGGAIAWLSAEKAGIMALSGGGRDEAVWEALPAPRSDLTRLAGSPAGGYFLVVFASPLSGT